MELACLTAVAGSGKKFPGGGRGLCLEVRELVRLPGVVLASGLESARKNT